MTRKTNLTCQVSSYRVENPPPHPLGASMEWLGIATAHLCEEPSEEVPGASPDARPSTVLQVVHARASGATQEGAMVGALKGLLSQLEAREAQRSGPK